MFEIFGYLFFFIIIYFIIQKNNSQEKFDDMPPLPGGTWTNYCNKDTALWTRSGSGCKLSANCSINVNGKIMQFPKSIILSDCNSKLKYIKNSNGTSKFEIDNT